MKSTENILEEFPLTKLAFSYFKEAELITCQVFDSSPKLLLSSETSLTLSTVRTERLSLISKDNMYSA